MTKDEIARILAKPYAQQLLNGPEPARLAYVGLDGHPRAIPIGFWTEGEQVAMATLPASAKVAALRNNPNVALTIDQGAFPPKVLLLRGVAALDLVEGIPAGYLAAGRKVMAADQYRDWVSGVQALYDEHGGDHDHADVGQAARLRNDHPRSRRRPHQEEAARPLRANRVDRVGTEEVGDFVRA